MSTQKMGIAVLIGYMLLAFNYAIAAQEKQVKSTNIYLITHKKTIEYGKSFKIKLKVPLKNKINISTLLKPLKNNFNYSIISQVNNKTYVTYKIKLFSLHKGIILIPALKYKQYKSTPVNITVTAPLTQNNQPISVSIDKTNLNPWVREQIRIMVTITTTEKNIILNNANINQKGNDSYLIPQTTRKTTINGETRYKHKIGWDVFFLYAQNTTLSLPVIEYVKNGVPLYKFYFQKINFNVKKLPIYINPTIPIGKIILSSRYLELPKTLLQPNKIAIIQYTLTGKGVPAKWLPSLVQIYGLSKNTDINFSPLNIQLNTSVRNNSIIGKKITDFTFTPLSNGFLPIKNIQLQYFDPETGLLKSKIYKHPKLLVLHWFIQIILLFIFLYIIYAIILKTFWFIIRLFRKYKYYSKYRLKIRNAETFNDIKEALKDYSRAKEWPTNITTNQWLYRLSREYNIPDSLTNVCNTLNQSLYAIDYSCEIDGMKKIFLNILTNLKRKPKNIITYLNLARINSAYLFR